VTFEMRVGDVFTIAVLKTLGLNAPMEAQ